MKLRRLSLLVLSMLCCLTAVGQGRLVFTPAEWDFGSVAEQDGPVSHTFTAENTGDKPVAILDVVSTCGCTAPEFSREPVLPGRKTTVKVTFDPANRPGVFAKELGVYSTERRKIASLTVRGRVIARPRSDEELYAIDAGGGLRLDATLCALSYVYIGRAAQSSIGFKNTSRKPLVLELVPQEGSGLLTVTAPERIEPGEAGEIDFAYSIPVNRPRYGTLRDALEVRVDGRTNGTTLVVHGIAVDDPAKIDLKRAPQAQLNENFIKFGTLKRAAAPVRRPFTLTNTGTGELIVRAVETDGRIATTLAAGQRIPPGQSVTCDVILDPGSCDYGFASAHLVVIANDPSRPMRRLRVTATIVD